MAEDIILHESDFLLYTGANGEVRVDVLFYAENVWLTQKRMAELFAVDVRTISEHLQNIFRSAELSENSVIRNFRNTASDGKTYETGFYSLEAVISVGYRVNSDRAVAFRSWANGRLREYLVKGFVIDEVRLTQGSRFGKDYFDELLEKIREIRASERRFYQKITDLYAQASIDYDKTADVTQTFYKTVQNKLHWAISGKTAAEIIVDRVDSEKPHMGLTTWKNAPAGKVMKSDVTVAKNYLGAGEVSELNRIVAMYLDYAENQAKKQRPVTMKEWAEKLDAFLRFNEYDILNDAGRVSHEVAKILAEAEFDKFRVRQDQEFISDFDEVTRKYVEGEGKYEPIPKVNP